MSVLLLFNPTPPTDIYTLSLHDALPILPPAARPSLAREHPGAEECLGTGTAPVSGRRAERGRAPAVGASRSSRWTDSFPRTAAPDHDRRGPRDGEAVRR